MRDERGMYVEMQIDGQAVKARSIYLIPQGSKRLGSDATVIFEGVTTDTTMGADIN